jgi:hypothetical protein
MILTRDPAGRQGVCGRDLLFAPLVSNTASGEVVGNAA